MNPIKELAGSCGKCSPGTLISGTCEATGWSMVISSNGSANQRNILYVELCTSSFLMECTQHECCLLGLFSGIMYKWGFTQWGYVLVGLCSVGLCLSGPCSVGVCFIGAIYSGVLPSGVVS